MDTHGFSGEPLARVSREVDTRRVRLAVQGEFVMNIHQSGKTTSIDAVAELREAHRVGPK